MKRFNSDLNFVHGLRDNRTVHLGAYDNGASIIYRLIYDQLNADEFLYHRCIGAFDNSIRY